MTVLSDPNFFRIEQTFGTHTQFTGDPLTPEKAFSSLALFNQLSGPLFMLPLITTSIVNGFISARRLQSFFMAQEVERRWTGDDWRDRGSVTGPPVRVDSGTD